jgi:hypothetical protein
MSLWTGRRVLEAYLLLFVHAIPSTPASQSKDYTFILDRTLNTYVLGEHVAPKWHLEPHILWAPSVSADKLIQRAVKSVKSRQEQQWVEEQSHDAAEEQPWVDLNHLGPRVVKSVGMHKVHGDIVQGIMGAVFHQFVCSLFFFVFFFVLCSLVLNPLFCNRVARQHTASFIHASSLTLFCQTAQSGCPVPFMSTHCKCVRRWEG